MNESEVETLTEKRKVNVSSDVLAQICPENSYSQERHPAISRMSIGVRIHLRLLWAQTRFRFNDFQTIRTSVAGLRLRVRLLWMKIRHYGRLSK